jgi:hypothetical protein
MRVRRNGLIVGEVRPVKSTWSLGESTKPAHAPGFLPLSCAGRSAPAHGRVRPRAGANGVSVARRWGQLRLGAGLAGPNHDRIVKPWALTVNGIFKATARARRGRPMSQRLHIPFDDLADYYEAGWMLYGPSDSPGFVTVVWKRLRAPVVPFACVSDVMLWRAMDRLRMREAAE